MANQLVLDAKLDSAAVDKLKADLINAHGNDLELDGSSVEFIGGLCLEALLCAQHIWKSESKAFALKSTSEPLLESLRHMGLTQDDFITGDAA